MSRNAPSTIRRIGNESESDRQWLNDVKDTILYDDKVSKPTIAKLTFEDTFRPVKWGTNDEDLPYKWFDESNHKLASEEA